MERGPIFTRIVDARRPDILLIRKLMPISLQSLDKLLNHDKETFNVLCQIIDVHLGGTVTQTITEQLDEMTSLEESNSTQIFGALTKTTGTPTNYKAIARDICIYSTMDTQLQYLKFLKYLSTIELLREISLTFILTQVNWSRMQNYSTQVQGFVPAKLNEENTLKSWPSSAIDHNKYGIHEAGYIPLIGLMVSQKVNRNDDPSWSIAFFIRRDIEIYQTPLDTNIRNDLKKYYSSLNQDVTRILMIFGVKMGIGYRGMDHVLCALIVREKEKTPFITLLDNTWFDPRHNEYHKYYVDFMLEIANVLEFQEKKLATPEACKKWVTEPSIPTKTRSQRKETRIQNPYQDVTFLEIPNLPHEWLKMSLNRPIQLRNVDSQALICPYHAALHILSCIYMETFDQNQLRDLTWDVHNLIDRINTEMLICVLAGCFTLTPVSVRKVLLEMQVPNINAFHVIDNLKHPPSDVYMWSISHSKTLDQSTLFGRCVKKLNVNILGHYPRNSNTTIFEWRESSHSDYEYTSGSIKPLLINLHNEASTFKSTNDLETSTGKRKMRTQMDLLDKITNLLLHEEI